MHLQGNLTDTTEIYSMRIFLSSIVVVCVFFLFSGNENDYSEVKMGLYRFQVRTAIFGGVKHYQQRT